MFKQITFRTSAGRVYGPYGRIRQYRRIPEHRYGGRSKEAHLDLQGRPLLYISGTSGGFVDSITFHFG